MLFSGCLPKQSRVAIFWHQAFAGCELYHVLSAETYELNQYLIPRHSRIKEKLYQTWDALRRRGLKIEFLDKVALALLGLRYLWNPSVRLRFENAFGYTFHMDVFSSVHRTYLRGYENESTRIFLHRLSPGDTVIDVGANVGWYSLLASMKVGPKGRVIAFEPNPKVAAVLRSNISLNHCANVTIEECALSGESGMGRLYLHPKNVGGNSLKAKFLAYTIVKKTTFDDYARMHNVVPDFVKLDVEGGETDVLKGMAWTLEHGRPEIMMEYNPSLYARYKIKSTAIELVRSKGYAVFQISQKGLSEVSGNPGSADSNVLCVKGVHDSGFRGHG